MIENPKPKTQNPKFWKIIIFLSLLLWLGILYARKIDLTSADLGRHLKNGEWVVEHGFDLRDKDSPLHENYYSYTNQDFPVINHHWGAGVIFYWLYKLSGFTGLSVFYILLSAITFSIFFYIACRESNFTLATLLSFLLAPLMAERTEIRPEVFSVLFSAIFFFLLWKYWQGKMSWKWLFLLVLFQILWVNSHIYFFLGIFITGVFWVSKMGEVFFQRLADSEFQKKVKGAKILTFFLFLVAIVSLLNPFGIEGLPYPLKIFKNYGYTIVENKSVSFVENYGVMNPNFALVKAVLILMISSFVLLFIINHKKISIFYLLSSIFFGIVGWVAIRNFTLLGFFALPVLAYNFHNAFQQKEGEMNLAKENGIAVLYIVLVVAGLYFNFQYVQKHWERVGIGLAPGVNRAAEFAKENGIAGPYYNNYDVGGYMIWNFYPKEKVFVDNRPEAYPDSFFSETYKPMQENADVFEKVDREYNFNAVFFYSHDITPWGINFLKVIKENPSWASVFGDDYAVIYLKKNETNHSIIEKYQIQNTKY